MIFRLLLISFILSLAFDAHAAIDTIRSSSGDSGGPCPSAAADAPSAAPGAPADAAAPAAARCRMRHLHRAATTRRCRVRGCAAPFAP